MCGVLKRNEFNARIRNVLIKLGDESPWKGINRWKFRRGSTLTLIIYLSLLLAIMTTIIRTSWKERSQTFARISICTCLMRSRAMPTRKPMAYRSSIRTDPRMTSCCLWTQSKSQLTSLQQRRPRNGKTNTTNKGRRRTGINNLQQHPIQMMTLNDQKKGNAWSITATAMEPNFRTLRWSVK